MEGVAGTHNMLGGTEKSVIDTGQSIRLVPYTSDKHNVFDAIADKEIEDREEEQLDLLAKEIDEIKKLLVEIKAKQVSTRGLVDTFRGADYDLEAVYERARQWRHDRDDWSREYTPTPPPLSTSNLNASEKSFLEELEEAGDTMDPLDGLEADNEVASVKEDAADVEEETLETSAGAETTDVLAATGESEN